MKIYFAADHAGFETKNALIEYVRSLPAGRQGSAYEVEDCGAHAFDETDDYPGIIASAAQKLSEDALAGKDSRAIVAGASGQGEAMVANRFRGVRCALYYGPAFAPPSHKAPDGHGKASDGQWTPVAQTDMSGKELDILSSTREHNDANALSLGLRFLTVGQAKEAVKKWLAAPFPGEERHLRRIKAIDNGR